MPTDDPKNLLKADPSTRVRHIQQLAGHLYRPPRASATQRTPGIVMAGPNSSVKEQTLPHYAVRLADAGYTVLAFDSRSLGESEETPRFHYDPNDVIADYRNAVSYKMTRDDIDPERVAVVGVRTSATPARRSCGGLNPI